MTITIKDVLYVVQSPIISFVGDLRGPRHIHTDGKLFAKCGTLHDKVIVLKVNHRPKAEATLRERGGPPVILGVAATSAT